MMQQYCQGCKQAIYTLPIIGDPHKKFEDGVYCMKCATVKIDKVRKGL